MSVKLLRSSAQSGVINMHSLGVVLDVGIGCKWNPNIFSLFNSLSRHEKKKNSSQIIHDLEDNGFISPTGTSNAALATEFLQFNYTREKSPVYEPMEPGRFLYAWRKFQCFPGEDEGLGRIIVGSGQAILVATWWIFPLYFVTLAGILTVISLVLPFFVFLFFFWLLLDMCLSFSTGDTWPLRMQKCWQTILPSWPPYSVILKAETIYEVPMRYLVVEGAWFFLAHNPMYNTFSPLTLLRWKGYLVCA